MKKNKLVAMALAVVTTLSLSTTAFAAKDDQYSGVGCYKAFAQIQTSDWVYRNNFDDSGAGYGTKKFNSVISANGDAATKTQISDTKLDGDGEYQVSFSKLDLKGSKEFNMLGISTNLPYDGKIKITDVSLKYDDKEVSKKFLQKDDDKKYVHIMLINQYDPALKGKVNTAVPADGATITMDFKVTGFGYEKGQKPTATTSTSETTKAPSTDATTAPSTDATTAPTATAAPTADSTKKTGDVSLALVYGALIVCAGGLVVVNLRRKQNH